MSDSNRAGYDASCVESHLDMNTLLNRLIRFGLAGAVSGFIGFALVNPMAISSAYVGQSQARLDMAYLFAICSAVISLGLVLAQELGSLQPTRIAVRGAKALAVGAAGGFVAGFLGQAIYYAVGSTLANFIGELAKMPARAVGWGLVGAIVGLANGIAAGSGKKTILGFVGGLIGGTLGGLLFDPVASIRQFAIASQSDTASRLVGLTAVGMGTGLAIALVEEIAKKAWIIVLAGRNEGREYILDKSQTRIGRDELADIPLFGDQNVAKLHGVVELTHTGYYFRDQAGGVTVNNQPSQAAALADGDVIRIGKFSLSFRTKGSPRSLRAAAPAMPIPAITPAQPTMPRLKVTAGPYAGGRFDAVAQVISIGRDPSSSVALEQDAGVSRRHATLSYENGRYVVRDTGSTNGTFLNGARISEAVLAPGDNLQVGATVMVLVFE